MGLRRYEVKEQCYVPMEGRLKYKRPGQVVSLSPKDAAKLSDYLIPVDGTKGVAKRNTLPEAETEPVVVSESVSAEPAVIVPADNPDNSEEVSTDAGEPTPVDE